MLLILFILIYYSKWKIVGNLNGYIISTSKKYLVTENQIPTLASHYIEWKIQYKEVEESTYHFSISTFNGLYIRVKNKNLSMKDNSNSYVKWKFIIPNDLMTKEYSCPKCDVKLYNGDDMWLHWIEHISEPSDDIIKCPLCKDKISKSLKGFSDHLNAYHSPNLRLPHPNKSSIDRAKYVTYGFSLVIIQHPETKKFVIVEEIASLGWYIPAGKVEVGESFQKAAIRECKEEAGIDVKLEGILQILHYPNQNYSRMSVIFYATPLDPEEPLKSEPDYESLRAVWITYDELLDDIKNKNKILRSSEALRWIEKVEKGQPIYPLDLLYTPFC